MFALTVETYNMLDIPEEKILCHSDRKKLLDDLCDSLNAWCENHPREGMDVPMLSECSGFDSDLFKAIKDPWILKGCCVDFEALLSQQSPMSSKYEKLVEFVYPTPAKKVYEALEQLCENNDIVIQKATFAVREFLTIE